MAAVTVTVFPTHTVGVAMALRCIHESPSTYWALKLSHFSIHFKSRFGSFTQLGRENNRPSWEVILFSYLFLL